MAFWRCCRRASGVALAPRGVDHTQSSVLLFPGQGSQFTGMANKLASFPRTAELFDCANEILGYDLHKICLEGPFEELTKTEVSQPAILVTSLAALAKLNHENPKALEFCKATAGLSLGEYCSLVFSGSLSFEDAVTVVNVRGKAMQEASDLSKGGMVSVVIPQGLQLDDLCNEAIEHCLSLKVHRPVCQASNFLSSSVQVVGGSIEAIQFILANYAKFRIRKCKQLSVSGAFHTRLMDSACDHLYRIINRVTINQPRVPVISNVTAKPYQSVEEIKELLIKHVVSPVRWEQSMNYIFNSHLRNPQMIYEMGPGRNLKPLMKSLANFDKHEYDFVDV